MRKAKLTLFGFMISEIVEITGLPFATVYRHAHGDRVMSLKCIRIYHDKLGVDLQTIMEWGVNAEDQLHAPA